MRDLNAMVTFVAVVDCHSFSLAAERSGVSKALVTKHIQELETALGVKLLNRTTRKLGLTQAGERFYERCVHVLSDADAAMRSLEADSLGERGLIRVSTAISFGRLHLLPAIADFLKQHSSVQVEVTLSEHFADLISGGADIVVRMADEPRLSNLVARKLAPARLSLVAAPAYLAAIGAVPSQLQSLLQSPLDLRRCNCLRYAGAGQDEWHFNGPNGTVSVKPSGNLRANNADGIVEAALAGVGIGVVPSFCASEYIKAGRLVQLLPGFTLPERTLYAVFLPDRNLPRRIRTFVRFLSERFGPSPYWDSLP